MGEGGFILKNSVYQWIAGAATASMLVTTVAGCGATDTNNSGSNATNQTTGATSKPVTITETGSSLLYPLFNGQWIGAYQSVDKNVTLNASSTGSGKGISDAIANLAQIGASDAYLSNGQMAANPSMLNIPLAISAQQVMYNLPGMKADQHLKLSGDVLAQIYEGKISSWDDAKIASMNPGVTLPNKPITPVHRSDSSGDTFLFTQFLTDTNDAWKNGPKYSTSVSWPAVKSGIGAKGNDGIVATLSKNPYSIAYVGISWLDRATQQGIGYAALQNHDGNFELPTKENIQTAASAMMSAVPTDERISLINAPGATSYPIINFEYAIVNSQQSGDMAAALKKFLNWSIDPNGGNAANYMDPVHFLPLPSAVQPKSQAQINKIGG
jgi:phosphate transport system substrate-binding protein